MRTRSRRRPGERSDPVQKPTHATSSTLPLPLSFHNCAPCTLHRARWGSHTAHNLGEKNAAIRLRLQPVLLTALLVICVLALLWFGRFQRQIEMPVQMAERMTRQSSEMDKAVGRSFTRGRIVIGTFAAARDNGTADVTIRIFGPRGQGKLYEWAQETNGSWQICSLVFRPDNGSQEIFIVPDESSHCERE